MVHKNAIDLYLFFGLAKSMATTKQCACGKVCGNGGALANHRKSKWCPLSNVHAVATIIAAPVANVVDVNTDVVTRLQLRNLEIEHEEKMKRLVMETTKADEETKLMKTKADEETNLMKTKGELMKARGQAETNKIVVETELMKELKQHEFRLIDEKIVRVRRTGDVYVEHVKKMTELAEEDAHQNRLLTICPGLLTRNEMRVYGTAYQPCFDKRDIERFIDSHLALEGTKDDVKAIVGKMALLQDNVMQSFDASKSKGYGIGKGNGISESMRLVPLRSLARINRLSEMLEDHEAMEDQEDQEEADDKVNDEVNDDKVSGGGDGNSDNGQKTEGGNRLVLSFEEQEGLIRSIKEFGNRKASDVDTASVAVFFENLVDVTNKAIASVTRHRVHVPAVLQAMVDEQCAEKAKKTSHNRFEFWAKKTGGASECPCETCGCALTCATFEMGHKVAKSRGGSYNLENLMVQCGSCNNAQGVLHPEIFMETMVH